MNPSDHSHEAESAGAADPSQPQPELPDPIIPFVPTEEHLAHYHAMRSRGSWTRHLRPVDAPAPAWATPPAPPPDESRAELEAAPEPCAPEASAAAQPAPAGAASPKGFRDITAEIAARAERLFGRRHPAPQHEVADAETSTHSTQGPVQAETADGETSTTSAAGGAHAGFASGETSATSAFSAGGCTREHPIPEDSILADYRDFVRQVSELPDGLIIAPVLALCGRLLTPNVTLDFGGLKPLTIYNFVTTPSGLRKSTTFAPAEKIARLILDSEDLLYGNASDSALFDTFEQQPHRLQFEDEGNTLLRTWETSAHGREVSARYLKLYDGSPWSQNYLRERKLHDSDDAQRSIPQATLSLCIGSTFGVARLDQLEAGSGLRRRFGFYLASRRARYIDWPETLDGEEINHLAHLFNDLKRMKGVIGRQSFTAEAWEHWRGLQQRNRERCESIPGYTKGDESLLSSLNESPARCLKLAVIFQACRWSKGCIADPYTITKDALELAEAHQNACLDSLVELEASSRRSEMEDTAEWLLAQISGDHPGQKSVDYTRSELTHRFAGNPGRQGTLTVSRLYGEILPRLMDKGHCHIRSKVGKSITYTFTWD